MRFLLVLAFLLATPAFASPSLEEMRAQALELVNRDRAKRGRKPLELDETLQAASQEHAEDMARRRYFNHKGKDGRRAHRRFLDQGGSKRVTHGENLAGCFGCPPVDAARIKRLHRNLMRSRDHKVNILRREFTRFGYGLARVKEKGKWRIYAVQTFSSEPPKAGAHDPMALPTRGRIVRKKRRGRLRNLIGR